MTDVKIKSEPSILTADNKEGEFFDGQDIPFTSSSLTTDVGGLNQSFAYYPVGIRLKVRPHITNDKNIDLTVSLIVSSTVPGRTLLGGAIIDRRQATTHVVLQDGETYLISGILKEEEREITRGVPGLSDIPLLGEVFKHREVAQVNTELLIFLTPYVIDVMGVDRNTDPINKEPLKRLQENWPDNAIGDVMGPEPATQTASAATPDVAESNAGELRIEN